MEHTKHLRGTVDMEHTAHLLPHADGHHAGDAPLGAASQEAHGGMGDAAAHAPPAARRGTGSVGDSVGQGPGGGAAGPDEPGLQQGAASNQRAASSKSSTALADLYCLR